MRRSRTIRLTLLPLIAASAVALGQEGPCLDGTQDEGCLRADEQVTRPPGPVLYGGFGVFYGARHVGG